MLDHIQRHRTQLEPDKYQAAVNNRYEGSDGVSSVMVASVDMRLGTSPQISERQAALRGGENMAAVRVMGECLCGIQVCADAPHPEHCVIWGRGRIENLQMQCIKQKRPISGFLGPCPL